MPQPTKIPRAFASSGDKNTIPDSTGSIGLASWSEGFPVITSTPFAQGGVAPKRADFNGIFNALSAATVWHQQGGVYAYDNTTNYEICNLVVYSNELYICTSANGPGTSVKAPTNTTAWTKVATAVTLGGYIPTTGGNVSGAITQTTSTATIRYTDTTGRVTIGGGTAYNTGAYIWLYGKDNVSAPGYFDIDANDGVTYQRLHGQPDGTLCWGIPNAYKNIAMREDGVLANMFFSQTSGTYTTPYTGVYKITLKGGGGGGGGLKSSTLQTGASGGEGATLVFYASLTKNQSYAYTIGAGGAAGLNDAGTNNDFNGKVGGNTSIIIGNDTYMAGGGYGGNSAVGTAAAAGMGGNSWTVPAGAVAYRIPGTPGLPAVYNDRINTVAMAGFPGGGAGGGFGTTTAQYGGGGGSARITGAPGSYTFYSATPGADGYILIEYAS